MTPNNRYLPLLIILIALAMTACATPFKPVPAFEAQQITAGRYDQRVDHLIFVLDGSSSMSESYQGYQKMDIARAVVDNFNDTMPDMDVAVALHSFGHADSVSAKHSDIMLPSQAYSRDGLSKALEKVKAPGGISPLEASLRKVGRSLKEVKDPIAIVIVSDGKDMGTAPLAAARKLKAAHGDNLCLYTVQVGDAADGKALFKKITEDGGCGKAVSAQSLTTGQAMNGFVKQVLLTAKKDSDGDGVADDKDQCPNTARGVKVDMNGCPLDSDNDGVIDGKDQCPDTPAGTKVDQKGCALPMATKSAEVTTAGTWIYKDIQFETNKADLRTSSFATLNEITEALQAQKKLNIEIQGHTDSSGARSYNMGLSQRRAQSVKAYLENKGIDPGRMTTKGFGPDRPIASNATKDGRARNRRVEIKPLR